MILELHRQGVSAIARQLDIDQKDRTGSHRRRLGAADLQGAAASAPSHRTVRARLARADSSSRARGGVGSARSMSSKSANSATRKSRPFRFCGDLTKRSLASRRDGADSRFCRRGAIMENDDIARLRVMERTNEDVEFRIGSQELKALPGPPKRVAGERSASSADARPSFPQLNQKA